MGHFYQLPPALDDLYGYSEKYCFQSTYFFSAIPHHIELETIFRQTDKDLIQCINNLEKGVISNNGIKYIKTLEREIPENENTIYLFARHYKTELFNCDKLKNMSGILKVYESEEDGDSQYLRKFQAPRKLGLKIGAPVILIVNLSDLLVNGSIGTVTGLLTEKVVVHFRKNNKTVALSPYLFNRIDPGTRTTLSKRLQIPLILAFGTTIHKSQGMTLESVIVDCKDSNIPGQIGVAMGRAVNSENLQVKRFRPHLIKEHSS